MSTPDNNTEKIHPTISYDIGVGQLPYDITVDVLTYTQLLRDQGITDDHIQNLHVRINENDGLGVAGRYDPQDRIIHIYPRQSEDGTKTININRTLLHETKHFIDDVVEQKRVYYPKVIRAVNALGNVAIGGNMASAFINDMPITVDTLIVAGLYYAKLKARKYIYLSAPAEERARTFSDDTAINDTYGELMKHAEASSYRRPIHTGLMKLIEPMMYLQIARDMQTKNDI